MITIKNSTPPLKIASAYKWRFYAIFSKIFRPSKGVVFLTRLGGYYKWRVYAILWRALRAVKFDTLRAP